MRSLRSRLLALWLMLAVSGVVTGLLLLELYRQSANAQVGRAEEKVARACRELADRYGFFMTGRRGGNIDDALKQELVAVVQVALARPPGVEGGIWQAAAGSLAYAFPSYEGTGPKTDLPIAELFTIRSVNADALREDGPKRGPDRAAPDVFAPPQHRASALRSHRPHLRRAAEPTESFIPGAAQR